MVREHKIPGLFSDQGGGFDKVHDPEFEIALALQHGDPGDPRLLDVLVERFGGQVFQFAVALLDQEAPQEPPWERICTLVEKTFAFAINNSERFWGESSVKDWLFAITLHLYRGDKRWYGLKNLIGKQEPYGEIWKKWHNSVAKDQHLPGLWDRIGTMPEDQRLALVLDHVFDQEASDSAQLLKKAEEQLVEKLCAARVRLLENKRVHTRSRADSHQWMHPKIHDLIAGPFRDDRYARAEVQRHLDECKACRSYYQDCMELDARIKDAFQARWSLQPLSAKESKRLIEAVRSRMSHNEPFNELIQAVKKGSWISVFIVLFIGIAWTVTRSGYLVEEVNSIPGPATPTSYPLPSPISVPASAVTIDSETAYQRAPELAFNGQPSISGDGRLIAFGHYEFVSAGDGKDSRPQIMLYDHRRDEFKQITAATKDEGGTIWYYDLVEKKWIEDQGKRLGWGQNPSISANGRWIVFTSSETGQRSGQDRVCLPFNRSDNGCSGIYRYDLETGTTQRIDQSHNGDFADRVSINPQISADGQKIVFWSSANNLVPDDPHPCQEDFSEWDRCFDVYVFNGENRMITQIPVGRAWGQLGGGSLDVSSDGQLVALNLNIDDLITQKLDLNNELEAFVYDLSAAEFRPLNLSSEDAPGNQLSYGAALSADGRFAGFVSHASNLVPEDTNEIADIFVRDLENNLTEQVSLSTESQQGFASNLNSDYRWWPVMDLSSDGRYITFSYGVNDLDGEPLVSCDYDSSEPCTSLYLHDLETGDTSLVASPRRSHQLISPTTSADGRYIAYIERKLGCSRDSIEKICAEIWLYDQETGWTTAVSKGKFALPTSRFIFQNPKRIPEVSSAMAISPDGRTIAAIYNAKNHLPMINLWSIEDGRHISFLKGDSGGTITTAVFSQDGEFIAAGLEDGSVDIWRLTDGDRAFKLQGQPGKVIKLMYSQDGDRLFVGSTKGIWIWELINRTFVRVRTLDFRLDSVHELTFSPDGRYLALAASDGAVWLQNINTTEIIARLESRDKAPLAVAFSPAGDKLAAGSQDGNVQIWKIDSNSIGDPTVTYLKTLRHPGEIRLVAFSPAGSLLASISSDGKLRLWDHGAERIVDFYPKDAWERVNAFAYSPDGKVLATSSWSGPTYVFRFPDQVDRPLFFQRAQTDKLSMPLAFPSDPSSNQWRTTAVNLYQAAETVNFDLKVPVYLPPGFVFNGVRFVRMNNAAWLKYAYHRRLEERPDAEMIIFQGPDVAEITDLPISLNALVERVQLNGHRAEIVQGDWIPTGTPYQSAGDPNPMVSMHWLSEAPTYRMRFQVGSRLVSIYYKHTPNGPSYLNKGDLIAIAQSMVSLEDTYKREPILLNYTAKEGDSCTSIADRFGTTVGEIVRQNGANSCPLILTGQKLIIPLNEERLTLSESDLNCDGELERVRIIPNPLSASGATVLGVTLETLSDLGLYQEAWRYTIADAQSHLLSYPQLYKVSECQQDLGINLLVDEFGGSRFEIYRWDGNAMLSINE